MHVENQFDIFRIQKNLRECKAYVHMRLVTDKNLKRRFGEYLARQSDLIKEEDDDDKDLDSMSDFSVKSDRVKHDHCCHHDRQSQGPRSYGNTLSVSNSPASNSNFMKKRQTSPQPAI